MSLPYQCSQSEPLISAKTAGHLPKLLSLESRVEPGQSASTIIAVETKYLKATTRHATQKSAIEAASIPGPLFPFPSLPLTLPHAVPLTPAPKLSTARAAEEVEADRTTDDSVGEVGFVTLGVLVI